MPERPVLPLARAQAVVARLLARAEADGGRPIAVAVVDDRGDLVAFARQDAVTHRSLRLAQDKAYTAALMDQTTRDFIASLARASRPVGAFADPRFVALAGGAPIQHDGRTLGAVGVSGRSSDEDHDLAADGAGGDR